MVSLTTDKSLIKEVQEWAYVYFVRFIKGSPLFVSKNNQEMKAMTENKEEKITLTEYRRKGINAYIASISIEGGKVKFNEFFNPTDYESQELRGRGKSVKCYFDQIKLNIKDGYFACREAIGHRSYISYLILQNYQIIKEFDNEPDFLDCILPLPEFPKLNGSNAQINFAEDIRAKAWQKGLKVNFDISESKYWIEKVNPLCKK